MTGSNCIQRFLAFTCIVFGGLVMLGCSSTASKVHVTLPNPQLVPAFRLIDLRPQESTLYSQTERTQHLGDNNFEIPPIRLLASRLDQTLGELLAEKEISLVEFQALITVPQPQTYPGMPLAAEVLGSALGLPQLGNPRYAHVDVRGSFQGREFSGAKSVPFYLGSGEAEVSEALDAAVNEAAVNLKMLLTNTNR